MSFWGASLPPVLAGCLTQSILCGVTQLHTWKGRVATEAHHITDQTHQSHDMTILTEACHIFDHTHLITSCLTQQVILLTTPTYHSLTTPTELYQGQNNKHRGRSPVPIALGRSSGDWVAELGCVAASCPSFLGTFSTTSGECLKLCDGCCCCWCCWGLEEGV